MGPGPLSPSQPWSLCTAPAGDRLGCYRIRSLTRNEVGEVPRSLFRLREEEWGGQFCPQGGRWVGMWDTELQREAFPMWLLPHFLLPWTPRLLSGNSLNTSPNLDLPLIHYVTSCFLFLTFLLYKPRAAPDDPPPPCPPPTPHSLTLWMPSSVSSTGRPVHVCIRLRSRLWGALSESLLHATVWNGVRVNSALTGRPLCSLTQHVRCAGNVK